MRTITRHLSPGLAVLAALGFAGTTAAAAAPSPPDLVPFVDDVSDSGSAVAVNKWYVDTTASPYSARLHFGTQVQNTGPGPFQITAGTASGPTSARTAVAVQQIADGGGGANTTKNLTQVKLLGDPLGGSGLYNWSIAGVAKYTLAPTSGATLDSALTSVCRGDDAPLSLAPPVALFDPPTCNSLNASAGTFSSGITNGYQDVIAPSSGNSAYFDVTSVAPGVGTFTATVDPNNEIVESNDADNVRSTSITVPGVNATAANLSTTTTTPVAANLAAAIVGGTVLGRKLNPALDPTDPAQPAPAAANGILTYAVSQPANGSAALAGNKVTYTAKAGFTGTDQFTFTATDSRGLRSTPATVTVTVNGAGATGGTGGTTGGGTVATRVTIKLKPAFSVVTRGNKRFLRVTGTLPTSQAGRVVKIQRKVGKRVKTIGTAKVAANGRYTKLVRVTTAKVTVRVTIAASATATGSTTVFRSLVVTRRS